jgi:hypothetical protein
VRPVTPLETASDAAPDLAVTHTRTMLLKQADVSVAGSSVTLPLRGRTFFTMQGSLLDGFGRSESSRTGLLVAKTDTPPEKTDRSTRTGGGVVPGAPQM